MALLQDTNGNQLSDQAAIPTRWKEHFSELLSRPVPSPPECLMAAAGEATVDESILTTFPTLMEVYHIISKVKSGKSPGICGIFPEYTHHAGTEAMKFLGKLFGQRQFQTSGGTVLLFLFVRTKARGPTVRTTEVSFCFQYLAKCFLAILQEWKRMQMPAK